jgi:hypothetical protein
MNLASHKLIVVTGGNGSLQDCHGQNFTVGFRGAIEIGGAPYLSFFFENR